MSKGPGFYWKVEGGGKAISYNAEQRPEFEKLRKYFIHYLDDKYQPVLDDQGKEKTGLKAGDKLTLIGYVDQFAFKRHLSTFGTGLTTYSSHYDTRNIRGLIRPVPYSFF